MQANRKQVDKPFVIASGLRGSNPGRFRGETHAVYTDRVGVTYEVGQVGDLGNGIAHAELEGNVGQQEDEGKLDSVLGLGFVHPEGCVNQGTNENLVVCHGTARMVGTDVGCLTLD